MADFREKYAALQNELKAPKSKYNEFGKYYYRSAEDIEEAVKPLLIKYGLMLSMSNDIIPCGDRVYVKSTAVLSDGENSITTTAYAREAEEKKGMDASQITGMATSYANKYNLNNMFLLDDTKDADSMDNRPEEQRQRTEQQDNLTKLKLFCGAMKGRPDVNTGCLTKYYNFYSSRVQNWPTFDPQATWDKWVANERES